MMNQAGYAAQAKFWQEKGMVFQQKMLDFEAKIKEQRKSGSITKEQYQQELQKFSVEQNNRWNQFTQEWNKIAEENKEAWGVP